MTAAGSAGTAGRDYKLDPPPGRHRAPPPVPSPRAPTVIAVAAAVLTAASLTAIAGTAVAPDARAAGVHGATVTTATSSTATAGPLVIPSIGVVAPAVESLETMPSAAPRPTASVPRGTRTPRTTPAPVLEALVAITAPSEQTVTPTTPAVTAAETTPTTPLVDAAVTPDSATPTQEQPVTTPTVTPSPTPDVTVDVPAGVTAP